jgi:hypothetical protein
MKQTVVGLYDNLSDAQNVVRALKDAGFSGSDISLVAHDLGGKYGDSLVSEKQGNSAKGGAAAGATTGAVLGGIGGLLVGLGALVIPGIGPVIAAGPLAAGISAVVGAGAGAVAGGVAGGLLGGLIGLGIPNEEAQYYAEGVRRGGALVSVTTDDKHAAQAQRVLDMYKPVNLDNRVQAWRQSGWKSYDEKAQPYTNDQIARERTLYGNSNTATSGTGTVSAPMSSGSTTARVYNNK